MVNNEDVLAFAKGKFQGKEAGVCQPSIPDAQPA